MERLINLVQIFVLCSCMPLLAEIHTFSINVHEPQQTVLVEIQLAFEQSCHLKATEMSKQSVVFYCLLKKYGFQQAASEDKHGR